VTEVHLSCRQLEKDQVEFLEMQYN
jgi:hypothetical protein